MYLGISCYNHESAAALVNKKGQLVNYYKEESLSRIKGDKSFPIKSINKILKENEINYEDIRYVSFYEKPLPAFLTPLKIALSNLPKSLSLISNQFQNFDKSSLTCFLDVSKNFPGLERKLLYLDHHLSHTLTALAYSTNKENICSVVVDGFGDRSTSSISLVNNLHDIRELWSCDYPVSLGLFYSAITDFLGFQVNEGEFKVMGLSAYGKQESKFSKAVSNLLTWDDKNKKVKLDMEYFEYHVSLQNSFSHKMQNLLGEPRNPFIPLKPEDKNFQKFADIAKGAQVATTKLLCKIFEHAYQLTGSREFLFSGGVAMNSASLEQIASLPFVDNICIPPSPGDSGSAIGSAFYSFLKDPNNKSKNIYKPSLFPSLYDSKKHKTISKKIISKNYKLITNTEYTSIKKLAELLNEGKVIGFIIGDSETGPRALGNRSLICNGENHEAVKLLNNTIKNRSPFRPTAPCMKLETAEKYYVLKKELMEAYKTMSATCKCKEGSISRDFPTTHIDLTARIQIVENGTFLDKLFVELDNYGINILANSSLNLSGDPTCFDLIDALMICSRSPLDYLFTDFGILYKQKQ